MREILTRSLGDGSQTEITLYLNDDGTLIVEAVNRNGTSTGIPPLADALDWYNHPFCGDGELHRLDFPVPGHDAAQRPLTADEYALAEALVSE